ncbi:MAG: hypothetical protein IT359_19725 [Gemmatimonadaceae bacterium]|nr:hypothetical protein [Gemmatimonadaceae bacterium]
MAIRPLIGVTLLLASVGGATGAREGAAQSRRVQRVALTPVWSVGGDVNDTTLLIPLDVRATLEHFVVYDGAAQRMLALSPRTGRIAWRFGRPGRGPGEFGGVAKVTARKAGGTFVVDWALSRLTEVTEDGKQGPRVDYRLGVNPRGVCEAGDTRIYLRSTESGVIERVQLPTGATSTEDLPWPELRAARCIGRSRARALDRGRAAGGGEVARQGLVGAAAEREVDRRGDRRRECLCGPLRGPRTEATSFRRLLFGG